MHDVLDKIAALRKQTSDALVRTWSNLSGRRPFSEKACADGWLNELHTIENICEDGWYAPPPHGIICKFGQSHDTYAALNQPSFRPPQAWPSDGIFYGEDDIALLYASPVDKATGLIGDFGINIYNDARKDIAEHLENVLLATLHIARHARPGMMFNELYGHAISHGIHMGLSADNVESATDIAGVNIGHSVPFSFEDSAPLPPPNETKEQIRKSRIFINAEEKFMIKKNMAFTLEPRFSSGGMPGVLFHMTIIFKDGQRHICHNYAPVFELAKMENLIRHLP